MATHQILPHPGGNADTSYSYFDSSGNGLVTGQFSAATFAGDGVYRDTTFNTDTSNNTVPSSLAVKTFVDTQIASFAGGGGGGTTMTGATLDDPTLTGDINNPGGTDSAVLFSTDTAATDAGNAAIMENSDTKLATCKTIKNFVDRKIADVIDSAPETLNTLSELSAALSDSPDTITALTSAVGTKQPIDGTSFHVLDSSGGTAQFSVNSSGDTVINGSTSMVAASASDTLTCGKSSGTGLAVTKDATIGGTLAVTGITTMASALDVNAAADVFGTLTCSATSGTGLQVDSNAIVTGSTTTDSLSVTAGIGAAGSKFTVHGDTGNTSVDGTISAGGAITGGIITDGTMTCSSGSMDLDSLTASETLDVGTLPSNTQGIQLGLSVFTTPTSQGLSDSTSITDGQFAMKLAGSGNGGSRRPTDTQRSLLIAANASATGSNRKFDFVCEAASLFASPVLVNYSTVGIPLYGADTNNAGFVAIGNSWFGALGGGAAMVTAIKADGDFTPANISYCGTSIFHQPVRFTGDCVVSGGTRNPVKFTVKGEGPVADNLVTPLEVDTGNNQVTVTDLVASGAITVAGVVTADSISTPLTTNGTKKSNILGGLMVSGNTDASQHSLQVGQNTGDDASSFFSGKITAYRGIAGFISSPLEIGLAAMAKTNLDQFTYNRAAEFHGRIAGYNRSQLGIGVEGAGAFLDGPLDISNNVITGATTIGASGAITGGTITDGTMTSTGGVLSATSVSTTGGITATGSVSGGTITDGTMTSTGGALSATSVSTTGGMTATGTVTGGTITDGTMSIASGSLTGVSNITATGTVTGGTITDGTMTSTGGLLDTGEINTEFFAAGGVTNSLQTWIDKRDINGASVYMSSPNGIQGLWISNAYVQILDDLHVKGSITVYDNQYISAFEIRSENVRIKDNDLYGVTDITAAGVISGASLTDGDMTIASGSLTGVADITASGTITDGTMSIASGSLTNVVNVTASGSITDGTMSIAGGSLTNVVNVTASGSITDGTMSIASGSLTGVSNITASGTITGDLTGDVTGNHTGTVAGTTITASGDVTFDAGASSNLDFIVKGGGNEVLIADTTSNVVQVSNLVATTSITNYSDRRIKTDIAPTQLEAVDILRDLKCYEFKRTDIAENNYSPIGFIAQEVRDLLPYHVEEIAAPHCEEFETLLSVRTTDFVPLLVKAVQELSDKVLDLEKRLAAKNM